MQDNNPLKFLNAVAALFLIGFLVFVLKELQSIFLPLFIAIIITFVVWPFYNFLINKKVPAAVSIIIVVLTIVIVSNIASVFILTSVKAFSSQFPVYETRFSELYNNIAAKLNLSPEEIASISESFDIKKLLVGGSLTSTITGLLSSITGLMGNYVLIIFYVIFCLSEARSIQDRIRIAFNDKKEEKLNDTLTSIFNDVKNYLAGKTLLSFIQAVVIGTFLWICGVDFFFIWAFMYFFSDFIPNIGSLIVTVLVAVTMLLQFQSIAYPAFIVAVLIVIQNLKGNILEPKIFGERLDLSPLLLLFSLIFWGYIWGIVGMILSVPIMIIIKIVLMNFPATRPYAILMSNDPEKSNKKFKIKSI